MILTSTAICTTGIQPQTIPITRHLNPICAEVRYTRRIPFQKTTASVQTTHTKSAAHKSLFSPNTTGSIDSRTTPDKTEELKKQISSSQPPAQIRSLFEGILPFPQTGKIFRIKKQTTGTSTSIGFCRKPTCTK